MFVWILNKPVRNQTLRVTRYRTRDLRKKRWEKSDNTFCSSARRIGRFASKQMIYFSKLYFGSSVVSGRRQLSYRQQWTFLRRKCKPQGVVLKADALEDTSVSSADSLEDTSVVFCNPRFYRRDAAFFCTYVWATVSPRPSSDVFSHCCFIRNLSYRPPYICFWK